MCFLRVILCLTHVLSRRSVDFLQPVATSDWCFCVSVFFLDNNKRKEEIIFNLCTPATSFCVWMVQQILDSPLGWLMSCLVWQERGRRISFDWQQEHRALRSAATSNTIDLEELAATVPQTLRLLQLDQLKEEVWVEAKNPEQEINNIVIHHIWKNERDLHFNQEHYVAAITGNQVLLNLNVNHLLVSSKSERKHDGLAQCPQTWDRDWKMHIALL